MKEVKEILLEQMELLAEASKGKGLAARELCDLTGAMVAIVETLKTPIASSAPGAGEKEE